MPTSCPPINNSRSTQVRRRERASGELLHPRRSQQDPVLNPHWILVMVLEFNHKCRRAHFFVSF